MAESFSPAGPPLAARRALVTGGSMGIGAAIARGLAAAGADVAIQHAPAADATLDDASAAERTADAIRALGRQAVVIAADFAHAGEAARTVADARDALGGLDILVIAAAVQRRAAFADITRDDVDRHVAVNFAATVELLQAALPGMAAAGWGRVVSIGSVNHVAPDPQLAIYAALKAAQHNLIVNLARVHAPHGVTLNTLSPGLVAVERNRWRREDAVAWAAIEHAANPMGRAGLPDEMVGAALMFCSDAGAFMTGVDLPVSGGGQL